MRWSATTTPFAAESCGRFVQVTSGDPYVVGENVYVDAAARAPSVGVCNGFTRGFDQDTGAGTSDTSDGALEAFRHVDHLELVGDFVAGTTCRGDGTGGFRLSGTINVLGEAGRDVSLAGGLPHSTFGAAGDLFQAGPGLLATQPGESPTADGVRAYRLETGQVPACGAGGADLCPHWAVATDGEVRGHPVGGGQPGGVETVFAGTTAGTVYAIEGTSGFVSWTVPVGAAVTATPALAPRAGSSSDLLFVPTADGRIVAVDPAQSAPT